MSAEREPGQLVPEGLVGRAACVGEASGARRGAASAPLAGDATGPLQVDHRVRAAYGLLLQAYRYATLLGRSVWDFAVETAYLRELGVTVNHLRWLVCCGHVQHAREITNQGDERRRFRATGNLSFTKRTCFVLTDAGVAAAGGFLADGTHVDGAAGQRGQENGNGCLTGGVPSWDCDRREIRIDGKLVKRFKLPSPNQETVLMAFQEEGWPPRIDDPLPPQPEQNPKRRLHDTIRSLNRNQKERRIRFKGDGKGEGILWEAVPPGELRGRGGAGAC